MNKIDEINNLIKKIKSKKNDIEKKIKDKFPELETFVYKSNTSKILPGKIIRYVDLKLKKISICGIVTLISYYDDYRDNNKVVKNIHLLSKGTNGNPSITWKISAKKYYIFESIGLTPLKMNKFINGFIKNLNNFEGFEEINGDDIFEEEIKKYKKENGIK